MSAGGTRSAGNVSARLRGWLIAMASIGAWAAYDSLVPPSHALDARIAIAAIDGYRAHISPHLRGVVACRFTPTCSVYGRESIAHHGVLVGGVRTAVRLARCGPWTPDHTYDPPR